MHHIYLEYLLKHKFWGSIPIISALLGQGWVLGVCISDESLGAAAAGTKSTLRTTVLQWSCLTIWGGNRFFPKFTMFLFDNLTLSKQHDQFHPGEQAHDQFYVSIPKFFLNYAYMKSLKCPSFLKQLETLSALNVHGLKSSLWELTHLPGSLVIVLEHWMSSVVYRCLALANGSSALCYLTRMPPCGRSLLPLEGNRAWEEAKSLPSSLNKNQVQPIWPQA